MLSEDEYAEFRRSIRDAGLSPDDFEISATDAGENSQKMRVELTDLSVRYLPTGVVRTYIAGFGYYWLRKLEKDVQDGLYGIRPPAAA